MIRAEGLKTTHLVHSSRGLTKEIEIKPNLVYLKKSEMNLHSRPNMWFVRGSGWGFFKTSFVQFSGCRDNCLPFLFFLPLQVSVAQSNSCSWTQRTHLWIPVTVVQNSNQIKLNLAKKNFAKKIVYLPEPGEHVFLFLHKQTLIRKHEC